MTVSQATERDARFMARALELALQAEGRTHPNPVVGCVITRGGHIIAQGHHAFAGAPHAEIMALRQLDGDPADCTMYVTLEPCCTHGRTPPCVHAILRAGIGRVVIGSLDPSPTINGKSVGILRDAGVSVTTGVLAEACDAANRAFFKHLHTGMPWITAKYAMTLDGKLATRTGSSAWISGEASRAKVHELRDRRDGIMVGARTALLDDPRLNCRLPGGRDPWRVILDARLELSPDARVFSLESDAPTILLATPGADPERRAALERAGAQIHEVAALDPAAAGGATDRLDMVAVLRKLGELGLLSVLVEGGSATLGALFDARLVDEVVAFVAPKLAGGGAAPSPVAGVGVADMTRALTLDAVRVEQVGDDVMWTGLTPPSWRAFGPQADDENAGGEL